MAAMSASDTGSTTNALSDTPNRSSMEIGELQEAQVRYELERKKRLQSEGLAQYVKWTEDPPKDSPQQKITNNIQLIQERQFRVIIVGAGFGGLLFAVRLLQSGFVRESDLLLIDTAGGFGGTWWWNQYPGLACDVESYTYMPLLEETQYMPSQRYASGTELKEHANRIADQWHLTGRALFRTTVNAMTWVDHDGQWMFLITPNGRSPIALRADFAIMATGLLDSAKIPNVNGLETYQGKVFHTSRWDYEYTGGTPSSPTMHKLQDKTIGFVGTGASAVQAVPHLAKWAKKVVVFQRTPSAVDSRHNSTTDPVWWARMVETEGPGWQRKRMENFNAFISNENPLPPVNLVHDGWTKMQCLSALVGGPSSLEPEYVMRMHQLDFPRQEAIRQRVETTVMDPATARALKPWYPGWCKRPCFSDTFLAAFNQPNVSLVDTDGKGIRDITPSGIKVKDEEYELDGIIFGTGYALGGSADRGDLTVTGRDGQTLQRQRQQGLTSLHGVMTHNFPNLFFPGPYQSGASVNQVYVLDQLALHVAHIMSEAGRSNSRGRSAAPVRFTIEPTQDAAHAWTVQVLMRARAFAGMLPCTPGYYNQEGQLGEGDVSVTAQSSIWGEGIKSYVQEIQCWRATGLIGLEVQRND